MSDKIQDTLAVLAVCLDVPERLADEPGGDDLPVEGRDSEVEADAPEEDDEARGHGDHDDQPAGEVEEAAEEAPAQDPAAEVKNLRRLTKTPPFL